MVARRSAPTDSEPEPDPELEPEPEPEPEDDPEPEDKESEKHRQWAERGIATGLGNSTLGERSTARGKRVSAAEDKAVSSPPDTK